MKTEFKLYITNPQYFNNAQNDFEKNLSGSIVVEETVAPSGMTEKTATAKVTGIPVPFRNPQSNEEIPDNDGTITVIGEPTMFLEPKVLATELIAVIIERFATKYGVNIDFSINAPATPPATPPPTQPITPETTTTGPKVGIGAGLGVGLAIGGGLLAAGVAGAMLIGKDGKTASSTEDATAQPPITPAAGGTSGTIPGTSETDTVGTLPPRAPGTIPNPVDPGAIPAPATQGTGGADTIGTLTPRAPGTIDNPVNAGSIPPPLPPPPTTAGTSGSATQTATDPIDTLQPKKLSAIPVLVPSQYIDCYELSKKAGSPALVTTPETKQMVLTDPEFDRPEFLPDNQTKPLKINIDGTGDFKINIEGGNPGGKKVGNWSEQGTQLIPTQDEQKEFFDLCDKHKELYGNKFSYTLATRPDWDEAQKAVQTNNAAPAPEPDKIDTLPPKAVTGVDNNVSSDGIAMPPPPIEKKVEEEVPVEEPTKVGTLPAKSATGVDNNVSSDGIQQPPPPVEKKVKEDEEQEPKKSSKQLNPTLQKASNNGRFGGSSLSAIKQQFNDEFLDSKKEMLFEALDELALQMKENPGWNMEVAGYQLDRSSLRAGASNTDQPGTPGYKAYQILNKYNQGGKEIEYEVTLARAEKVKEYLVSKGVSAGQISTIGSVPKTESLRAHIRIKVIKENGSEFTSS